MKMISIPIDIVNYICKLAAGHDKLWYPFFSPKTEKVSWKVNPHCMKFRISSTKFLNPIREEDVYFYNSKTGDSIYRKCRMITFGFGLWFDKKNIYIEFDSSDETDNYNIGKFMFRVFLNTLDCSIKPHNSIYLNGTEYATIDFSWIINNDSLLEITIIYEPY
jgi:hypothetical protein